MLSDLSLLCLFVEIWVALHVEVTQVLQFLDLGLESRFGGKLGKHIFVGSNFSLFHQFFLVRHFVELLLQISEFLSFLGEEEVVEFRELEGWDISLLL